MIELSAAKFIHERKKEVFKLNSIVFMLLIQIVLIALNAIFASAEIAVLSMNETKLQNLTEQGDKRAKRLSKLTGKPEKFLATIQVAITLSGFLGSAFAADNFSGILVDALLKAGVPIPESTLDTIAVILITLILSYFTLIFGELVPKRVAMKKSEQTALGISGLLSGISVAFSPIVWFLSVSTNAVLRLMGIDPNADDDSVSEEEIRMMAAAGSKKGIIDREENTLIQNAFEFDDLTAEEIATHRTDVDLLWNEESMDDWAQMIHQTRHTLYPICQNSQDNIIGILNAKDYFRLENKTRENIMKNAVTPAYFVPETLKADVLFRNMKTGGHTMAVVIDEYGGMTGIVTLNDLVEQLVGDFAGECASEASISRITDALWSVSGNVSLDELTEETGVSFASEDADTLSGLVFGTLGVIPEDGVQNLECELSGLHIRIQSIREHQIEKATVRLVQA